MKRPHPYPTLGRWMFWFYRDMAKERGIPYTRVRMRKASIPEPMRDLILSPDPMPEPMPDSPSPHAPAPRGWRWVASLFTPQRKAAP